MNLNRPPLLPLPLQLALHRSFPHSLVFGLMAGAVATGLGWSLTQVPHTDIATFQATNSALRECQDALTGQKLAGHRLDSFRLLPSSVTPSGEKVSAQYRFREHGDRGWNSGPILTLRCDVDGAGVHLSLTRPVEAHE